MTHTHTHYPNTQIRKRRRRRWERGEREKRTHTNENIRKRDVINLVIKISTHIPLQTLLHTRTHTSMDTQILWGENFIARMDSHIILL